MDENFKNEILILLVAIERHLEKISGNDELDTDEIDGHVYAIREDLKRKLSSL